MTDGFVPPLVESRSQCWPWIAVNRVRSWGTPTWTGRLTSEVSGVGTVQSDRNGGFCAAVRFNPRQATTVLNRFGHVTLSIVRTLESAS